VLLPLDISDPKEMLESGSFCEFIVSLLLLFVPTRPLFPPGFMDDADDSRLVTAPPMERVVPFAQNTLPDL